MELLGSGILMPRSYGLRIWDGGELQFATTSNYARGALALSSNYDLQNIVFSWAQDRAVDPESTLDELLKLVGKKNERIVSLGFSGREVFKEVTRYAKTIKAIVHSFSDDLEYDVILQKAGRIGNPGSTCTCGDYTAGKTQNLEVVCQHIAALQVALKIDKRGEKARYVNAQESVTGLTHRNRVDFTPKLPFNLKGDDFITIINQYYSSMNQSDVDQMALDHLQMLTSEANAMLKQRFATREFRVQKEQTGNSKLDPSIRQALRNLEDELLEKNYYPAGHPRELINGEAVLGRRYKQEKNQGTESVIVVGENTPPLLLEKRFGGFTNKAPSWDVIFPKGERVDMIDDATRREVTATIRKPKTYAKVLEPVYDDFFIENRLF